MYACCIQFAPFRSREQYLWLYRDARDEAYRAEASVLYLYSRVAATGIAGLGLIVAGMALASLADWRPSGRSRSPGKSPPTA